MPLRYDKDLRVLVITGKGNSFSAGEDLKELLYEQRERHGVRSAVG